MNSDQSCFLMLLIDFLSIVPPHPKLIHVLNNFSYIFCKLPYSSAMSLHIGLNVVSHLSPQCQGIHILENTHFNIFIKL